MIKQQQQRTTISDYSREAANLQGEFYHTAALSIYRGIKGKVTTIAIFSYHFGIYNHRFSDHNAS